MKSMYLIYGKKVLLLFLVTGFVSSGIICAQWRNEKSPTTNDLNAIFLRNINSGWIVGAKGTILKKTANGWEDIQTPTNENLYSVVMVDDGEGWAVGSRGTIIQFDGKTWKTFESPTPNNLYSVSFKDSKNGIAVGDFGTILSFKDGKWNIMESVLRCRLFAVSSKKDFSWIGGGLECVKIPLMKIVIQNKSKTIIDAYDSYVTINSIIFLTPDNGWAVGSPSAILHFDGQQWEPATVNEKYPSMNSVYFADDNSGISVGCSGTILVYNEHKWLKEKSGTSQDLNSCYKTGNTYYAIGKKGTIISSTRDLDNKFIIVPEQKFGDLKVFPNPCDEVLNILLPPENAEITNSISISGMNGQVLMQEQISFLPGSTTYQVATSGLRDGFYLFKICRGQWSETIKFIVKH